MYLLYLYNKIGLKQIEEKLSASGIVGNNIDDNSFSKYFSILNEVDEDSLPILLKEKYNRYFSLTIEELCNPQMMDELAKFFEESYKLLFFPKNNVDYIYYGPINYKYMAPRDSIVLGFYFQEFNLGNDNFEEKHFENDCLICDCLNYIQQELATSVNVKIAVIKYNEFFNKNHYKL